MFLNVSYLKVIPCCVQYFATILRCVAILRILAHPKRIFSSDKPISRTLTAKCQVRNQLLYIRMMQLCSASSGLHFMLILHVCLNLRKSTREILSVKYTNFLTFRFRSSQRTSKNYLLLIQSYYKRKRKLN